MKKNTNRQLVLVDKDAEKKLLATIAPFVLSMVFFAFACLMVKVTGMIFIPILVVGMVGSWLTLDLYNFTRKNLGVK